MDTQSEKGPVLGIIIIIVLLVAGGLFVLNNSLNQPELSPSDIEAMPDEQAQALGSQADSTELGSIEADANATNLSNLDADVNQIEQAAQ